MDDGLRQLLALAWKTVPAVEANVAIASARRAAWAGEDAARRGLSEEDLAAEDDAAEAAEADGALDGAPMARSYELLLAPDATFAGFAERELPRLVYHLESIGAHLPGCGGVVVAAFDGDTLRFVRARDLLERTCKALAVSPHELVQRHGTGESRTAQRGPPLLLAPPGGDGK